MKMMIGALSRRQKVTHAVWREFEGAKTHEEREKREKREKKTHEKKRAQKKDEKTRSRQNSLCEVSLKIKEKEEFFSTVKLS